LLNRQVFPEIFDVVALERLSGNEFAFRNGFTVWRNHSSDSTPLYSTHSSDCTRIIAPGDTRHRSRTPNDPSTYCRNCMKAFRKSRHIAKRTAISNRQGQSSMGPFDQLISPCGDVLTTSSLPQSTLPPSPPSRHL
jgi:hypothetical protein